MKAADIKAGHVYASANNRWRKVMEIWEEIDFGRRVIIRFQERQFWGRVVWGEGRICLLSSFARWAVREVPEEEL